MPVRALTGALASSEAFQFSLEPGRQTWVANEQLPSMRSALDGVSGPLGPDPRGGHACKTRRKSAGWNPNYLLELRQLS